RNVLVLDVAHLSDRSHAVDRHDANFAGRQPELRHPAFLGDQLRKTAGGPGHLAALARLQLDVVNLRAERNVFDRKRVAGEDVRFGPGYYSLPHLQPGRRDDVALLPVDVVDQGDARRAIRIVLNLPRVAGGAGHSALSM